MKALGYLKSHSLNEFQITEMNLPEPSLLENDVLVRIHATSVNPVDYKIRMNRSGVDGKHVILGWDASGVIEKLGSGVKNFKVGDEVFYAGDLFRDGTNAELQAVDSRVIALKPKNLSHQEAAAIPLTAITAYEALISQKTTTLSEKSNVLIIGGAGGVGSIGIQLLKSLTKAKVFATASREESKSWCLEVGADQVLDHSKDLKEEMKRHDVNGFDLIFSTNQSDRYFGILPDLLKPFGHYCLIDDPATFDIKPFKSKSITTSWEFMFTKTMFKYDQESQGALLSHVAQLIEAGRIKTTLNTLMQGLTAENLKQAHTLLESGQSIGKIVLSVKP